MCGLFFESAFGILLKVMTYGSGVRGRGRGRGETVSRQQVTEVQAFPAGLRESVMHGRSEACRLEMLATAGLSHCKYVHPLHKVRMH